MARGPIVSSAVVCWQVVAWPRMGKWRLPIAARLLWQASSHLDHFVVLLLSFRDRARAYRHACAVFASQSGARSKCHLTRTLTL